MGRTNRGKSCIGVVPVGSTIHLRRVLGCIGRLAAVCAPTTLLVLVDVSEVGLCGAPSAIGDR